MIHPDWLCAFEAFADTRSFTEAARRLHLTQPAVHAQVRKLGDALGVALYERSGRGVAITVAGERVLAYARETLEREATLRASLEGRDDVPVVLAAGEGSFLYLLPEGIRATVKAGDVALRLLTTSAEGALDAVRTGRAHLAVAVLPEIPSDLDGRVVARVGAKVVMPRGHRLAKRRRIAPSHLEGEPLILPPRGRPHREAVLRAFADANVSPNVVVEAHGWEVLMHYAALGVGVAIVNGICRPPARLVSRPFAGLPSVSYYLIHRPRALDRDAVRSVHDHVVAATR